MTEILAAQEHRAKDLLVGQAELALAVAVFITLAAVVVQVQLEELQVVLPQ
jgi:hypothetical protein